MWKPDNFYLIGAIAVGVVLLAIPFVTAITRRQFKYMWLMLVPVLLSAGMVLFAELTHCYDASLVIIPSSGGAAATVAVVVAGRKRQ